MGIRLDWEIEAEQTHLKRAGEEPGSARRRRRARLRFLLFILIILGIFASLVGLVYWRLQALNAEVEQALRNTVEAEVAALRLGDYFAFSQIQRSATSDWLQSQQQVFNQYQDLKLQQGVELTGQVLDVQMDRTRARVKVQEIVDGIPYVRLWFYWRYDDGWRHVPPDYTFWGMLHVDVQAGMTVRFQDVDAPVAGAIKAIIPAWTQFGCSALQCVAPVLSVDILPDPALQASWLNADSWQLQIPSPFITRAREDLPFDGNMQFAAATLLADRLVGAAAPDLQQQYPTDVYYLRQAVVSWLVGRLVRVNTNSFLIDSLTNGYGDDAVGRLLSALRSNSSIAVFSQVTGRTLDQTGLDWRDYLTWRLVLENELIQIQDETNFLSLYDTLDEAARNLAYQRYAAAEIVPNPFVTSVQSEVDAAGFPTLRAIVQTGEGQIAVQNEVLFRLVDEVWKRLN
ncbi:MAG: hypothetical protein R3E39_02795 [Anaerolineae bacterium]